MLKIDDDFSKTVDFTMLRLRTFFCRTFKFLWKYFMTCVFEIGDKKRTCIFWHKFSENLIENKN